MEFLKGETVGTELLGNISVKTLKLKQCTLHPAFYYLRNSRNLFGSCAMYFDDNLHGGDPSYCNLSERIENKLTSNPNVR